MDEIDEDQDQDQEENEDSEEEAECESDSWIGRTCQLHGTDDERVENARENMVD